MALSFRPAEAEFEERADGSLIVRCPTKLEPYPTRYTEYLEHWAARAPDRLFLTRRHQVGAQVGAQGGAGGGEWRGVTYAEMLTAVRAIGQALIDRGLSAERPVAILSGNDVEQQMIALAAMHVGVPVAPISPSYSLLATDFAKLRHVLSLVTPGLVFVNDGAAFARAIAGTLSPDLELVVTQNPPEGRPATLLADLLATTPTDAVDRAAASVTGDTVAKLLFTSGSTGMPKGVTNTHRVLCSNMRIIQQTWTFMLETPPVLVDWLPWNHTAGGNNDFGIVLANGGTMYIDDGKPTPNGFAETLRNLREIPSTLFSSMPKCLEELAHEFARDRQLRETFFSRMQLIFYAGASLAAHVWKAIDDAAIATLGHTVPMMTGLGSTETGPFALCASMEHHGSGVVGLPAPGVELKLLPSGDKLEMRIRSPSVTPGYWRQPELTAAAFDEEGFYRMGDALRFADPANRLAGFMFDGRITEDFKLTTGTWVSVGNLRTQLIVQFAPTIRDVVIAGHDRDYIAVLLVPVLEALRAHAGDAADVLAHPKVQQVLREKLRAHAAAATGSSMRVMRALVLREPLTLDRGELTDKGSISQRTVLQTRAHLVAALFEDSPGPDVICVEEMHRAA
jgi:feruloyl-CoA synthase